MNFPDALIFLSVFSFLLSIVLQISGYVIFRRNIKKFEVILSEFRQRNLQLDITTNISSYFSASFHPLKIAYFAYLYKGVMLYHKRNERVNKETYDFIQSLPKEKINWLLRLHTLNLVTAFFMIGGGVGFIILRHYYS